MRNTQRTHDDEDEAFENGILKDGARYSVPLRLMDSWQRDVAQHFDKTGGERYPRTPGFIVRDGVIRTVLDDCYDTYDAAISLAWKKPSDAAKPTKPKKQEPNEDEDGDGDEGDEGFEDARKVLADAYESYDAAISAAWKNKDSAAEALANVTGAGSRGPRGQQEGAVCTINGSPGHLRSINGELKCVPDKKRADRADHRQTMDALYAERDLELANAWRRAT